MFVSLTPTAAVIVPVILQKKLRESIRHASLICPGHEDTKECKIAWDRVEDIQKAIHKHKERTKPPVPGENMCEIDPLACREYDV